MFDLFSDPVKVAQQVEIILSDSLQGNTKSY